MLPPTLPLFPLSNVVLFPGVFLPLHIFEPRYRRMVADALAGDRMIGMTLLRAGWESDYEGRPAIYATGCAGVITHAEPLDDGRYNIVLKGLSRFRVLGEEGGRDYRVARVEALADTTSETQRAQLQDGRHRLELMIAPALDRAERRLPANLSDDEVVNALSQYLELEIVERQALLECAGPADRCRLLLELIQMRMLAARHRNGSGQAH
jgi:hypothetical protein